MTAAVVRVSERWLALREPADAAARSRDLAEELERHLPSTRPRVIHDLGCGTGSMGRWLAPLLPGPQHWVLHDIDPDLLEAATTNPPPGAADGAPVTVAARRSDITRLASGELRGANLVTASALLDMLTPQELDGLVGVCVAAGCPALLTLSVVGRVELARAEPWDHRVAAAFNAHQRRRTARGGLLGPDAVARAAHQFGRLGARVLERSSPWRLGAAHADLAVEWFGGWIGAACEQEPDLADQTVAYSHRRLAEARAGQLAVTVGHADLLVLPGRSASPHR